MKPRNRLEVTQGGNPLRNTYYRSQTGFDLTTEKGKPPLPYITLKAKTLTSSLPADPGAGALLINCESNGVTESMIVNHRIHCINGSYAKLVSRLRDRESAEIGAFVGESRQSLSMMNRRAKQMQNALSHIKKLKFRAAGRAIGATTSQIRKIPRKPPTGSAAGAISRYWLEWNYGWAPAIGDILGAVQVLGSNPNMGAQSSRAGVPFSLKSAIGSLTREFSGGVSYKQGGTYRINNPNHFLLNQLGLTNPVAVGWELVPYSFLIDQMVNVSNFLESWTDFYGLDRKDEWAIGIVAVQQLRVTKLQLGSVRQLTHQLIAARQTSLIGPILHFGGAFGLVNSVRRVANNLALAITHMR